MSADIHAADAHHGPNVKAYFAVFGVLSIFTALSFVANYMAHGEVITHGISFVIILGIAVFKAVLVGMVFMHLKWDWGKLFFMIVPAFIIATMMIVVFLPDMVLAWRNASEPPPAASSSHP